MKKKILLVIGMVLCLGCFTACGSNNDSENSSINQSQASIRGTWNDNVYTNEFANLKYTLPEQWQYATDEEIASIMGTTEDTFDKVTYDMVSQNLYTGSNIILMFEDLSKSIGGSKITEEDYMDITTQQLKDIEELDYKFGEPFETTIGENKYLACKVELTDNSMTQIYYIRKLENHMLAIIVTANNASDVAEDLIADFN